MTRKKKEDVKESKKISPDRYWEWRCTAEELKSAKLNEKRVHLEQEILNKELENRKLKLALFRETVRAARRSVEAAESEYEKFKQRLEEELEISLNNCVIDEYTFEVKQLDESED